MIAFNKGAVAFLKLLFDLIRLACKEIQLAFFDTFSCPMPQWF